VGGSPGAQSRGTIVTQGVAKVGILSGALTQSRDEVDWFLYGGRSVYEMSLNIKNEEAHRLAQELARLTGESMTAAVTEAVRERLERVRRKRAAGLADRLLAIGKDCAAHLKEPFRSVDHGELLYDERGLPR
jgi:antitoxin VapB